MNMVFMLILALICIKTFSLSLTDSLSNETDMLALLDFKNLITNSDSVLGKNWTGNTSFCSWTGVACSPRGQRVTGIELPIMNLEGEISPSIANLSFLTILDLINNSFHGSFPFEPGNFLQLRVLDVHDNNLTGSIHLSIGNFPLLERLVLSENSFVGEIPWDTGNMSSLVVLDLAHNQLTGSIPSSIFSLVSLNELSLYNNSLAGNLLLSKADDFLDFGLEAIDLSYNKLTGDIPSGLCRFKKLKSLNLSYNNLTGSIPENIGCLSQLERLYMTENSIVGNIPPSLGNISTLQFLGCVGNNIGGSIPPELGKLMNLQMLGFDFNNLTGEIPPGIFNLSSLRYMAFTENGLWGHLPANIGLQLPNLQGIYLAENLLEGEIPMSIANASKLQDLELSYNFFIGTVPANLGNLKELIFLNLAGNQLTNEPGNEELVFLNSLVECRMLQFLIVSNNPLGGSLPNTIQNLSRSIQMFNMENSQVSGEIPGGIGNLSSMISLVLSRNLLVGNIPIEIGHLNQLQRLYLSRNRLDGDLPTELCNLVNLGEIVMFENDLSGSIPSCIGNLQKVQRLFLSHNRLNSTLPLELWGINDLLFLNLSNNLIQGELHPNIGMLSRIDGVDLSRNQITGAIPSSLGVLENLRHLSLSSNLLNGSIPTSFGNLLSLEVLDLSSNNLSGTIPVPLERLVNLKEIDLSYNQLEGEIPQSSIFLNSSRRDFEGNKDLCGLPTLGFPLCSSHNSSQWSRSRKLIIRIIVPVIASVTLISVSLSIWMLKRRKKVKLDDPEETEFRASNMISYQEILRATNGFNESTLLGVGSSGSVFKAILSNAEVVAIKVLNLSDDEAKRRFDAECEILKQIRHRNLVRVVTTCSNDYIRAIILPYMSNGNLDSWLYKQGYFLNLQRRIEIMLDVAMAIEYLHHGYDFPVVHCDLKPSNVLLDGDMVAHVSDFGISKILAGEKLFAQTKTLGTIGYIAPEYGSNGTVSTAGDVYSYGIMLMEVLVRQRPTGELFIDNLNLRQWVKEAYPNSLREVVDANLFENQENGFNVTYHTCLLSLLELSLDCSKDAPEDRINMEDAVVRLTKIKDKLI